MKLVEHVSRRQRTTIHLKPKPSYPSHHFDTFNQQAPCISQALTIPTSASLNPRHLVTFPFRSTTRTVGPQPGDDKSHILPLVRCTRCILNGLGARGLSTIACTCTGNSSFGAQAAAACNNEDKGLTRRRKKGRGGGDGPPLSSVQQPAPQIEMREFLSDAGYFVVCRPLLPPSTMLPGWSTRQLIILELAA